MEVTKLNDDALIERCRDRGWADYTATNHLADRTYGYIRHQISAWRSRWIFALLGMQWEDAIQDVQYKIFRALCLPPDAKGRYRPGTEFSHWVSTICRNYLSDLARKRDSRTFDVDGMRVALVAPLPDTDDLDAMGSDEKAIAYLVDQVSQALSQSAESEALKNLLVEQLKNCLGSIRDDFRTGLVLYSQGYSGDEISRELNAPRGTVRQWRSRAIDQLKQCLEPFLEDDEIETTKLTHNEEADR